MPPPSSLSSSSLPSAMFGQPVNTEDDYYVTKGMFRMWGVVGVDPSAGVVIALQPPPGYVFESRVVPIVAGSVLVLLAMIIPTTVRLVLRGKKDSVLRFGWDDWTILLAMIVAIGYPITQIILPLLGTAGLHTWDMTYTQFKIGFHGAMIARSIFYVAVGLTKLSITLFVRRMAYRASRRWQIFIDVFLATVVAYVLLAVFWNLFACNPIDAHGDLSVYGRAPEPPVCVDYVFQSRVFAGVHLAQGVVLLTTPVVFLWKVRIDRAKKIRLYVIWLVGALAVCSGMLRELRPVSSQDISWGYTETLVWTSVDLTLELLVASLPVLDGMLASGWHRAAARVMTTKGGGGGGTGSRSGGGGTGGGSSGGGIWSRRSQAGRTITTISGTHKGNMIDSSSSSSGGSGGGGKSAMVKLAEMHERSESRESIVPKGASGGERGSDDGMEMTILRTQEVRVLYSPKQEHFMDGGMPATARKEHYLDRPEWRQDGPGQQAPEQAVVEAARMPGRS
ncbi:hypothetical protein Micbo1qcDRAFT_152020 [Microdochium bolleyi]|uniref:Rhodopsin domain-containing protein n=1 Tax=Microdochium bolleyi TaxID=196109 RepID=A0A136IQQ7_9PEZI|nr:hypothetical protein Micbo1qcDRAFT_152020 [Microdochium bolleyi]